jgi:hypothetical protein
MTYRSTLCRRVEAAGRTSVGKLRREAREGVWLSHNRKRAKSLTFKGIWWHIQMNIFIGNLPADTESHLVPSL